MDTATTLGLVGLIVAVLFGVAGILFGLDQRRSAREIERGLGAALDLLRERDEIDRPEAEERLVEDAQPRGTLSLSEQKDALADTIARLPEREKLVVTLYYYEELTLREISEVLGVTESHVSQLLSRATARLREAVS